ncbi:Beta-lactamase enzyme family protein [Flexibacter flexilis DSM 6793]|uniref:Beta-lactamase enzyme family protein n=1 Tax=Flexibacter flexilis DSM 6793 TaxID=927664 RepID=A0A1I1DJL0_9BACT|nr:serine hydrolase [Flexibacter flexilis]SFB74552.1 Beta-lactamase enzyme family protein [Flexibacter flexilis DSM 6793]
MKHLKYFCLVACMLCFRTAVAQPDSSQAHYTGLVDSLLRSNAPLFGKVLNNLPHYDVQIIYTRIFRDKDNKPRFEHHTFQLDTTQYFNPASTVKLPSIALTLEKLNHLQRKGVKISKNDIIGWGATPCQRAQKAFPARHTLAEYMKRMLLVSDNNGYNRLYDFLGQAYVNDRLEQLGYKNARIIQKFMPCTPAGNCQTPVFSFYSPKKKLLYKQAAAHNSRELYVPLANTLKGKGYYSGGRYVAEPYPFTYSNFLSLKNLHDILTALIFPYSVPKSRRFDLTTEDYQFIRKYMSRYPRESEFAEYKRRPYNDSYKKYLLYGQRMDTITDNLRIFNIVGLSYGYQIDCAYIADFENNTEFMISAIINVNENCVYNDGVYAYGLGFNFLKNLGQVIRQYEKATPKPNQPNLRMFQQL